MQEICKNLDDVNNLAKKIASKSKKGDVITLNGDLGSGKTAFSRLFIQSLIGDNVEVISPTFMLLQTYPHNDIIISHFDLYRIKHFEELYEIGLEEAIEDGIVLIEWPEISTSILPKDRLEIEIKLGEDDERVFYLNPKGKCNIIT